MPDDSEIARRNKALFAFFMFTGARVKSAAALKLKHVNLAVGRVFQDGREVDVKKSKAFMTGVFPVDPAYLTCLAA